VPHAFAQRVGSMSRETPNVKTYRRFTPQKRPAKPIRTGYEDRLTARLTSIRPALRQSVLVIDGIILKTRVNVAPCHDQGIKISLGH
jgi:hypothetical protein